jgi:hypothetical protein
MSDQTVVDVLEEVGDWTDVEALRQRASDDYPDAPMDREDWLRPLRLTGGQVCLRVQHEWHESYVTFDSSGHLVYHVGTTDPYEAVGKEALTMFKSALHVGHAIEPVLREETPFAEEEVTDG